MSRRRITAHTLKRRLMRKLDVCSPSECESVLLQLREYVIARKFLDGASREELSNNETVGNQGWTVLRIEDAIRRGLKLRGRRSWW